MTYGTSKNKIRYELRLCLIKLDDEHTAIIDADDLDLVKNYTWRAVKSGRCFYAKTTVGPAHNRCDLSMHRLIDKTPTGMVCHHRNRNSMDNRRSNLVSMTKAAHDSLHSNNNLKIKYIQPQNPENAPSTVSEGGIVPT